MVKNYVYDPQFGIAGIEDPKTKMRVYTVVQQHGIKKAAFTAYSGARYSRSEKSMLEILKEVVKTAVGKNITMDEHAAERVEQIVNSYGHPSVADMSHNFICIENIPMITMMRFFYLNPKQDGQERSTRFQDFSNPNFWIPESQKDNEEYKDLLMGSIDGYNHLKDETYAALQKKFNINLNDKDEEKALEARTFDTLRHFIPMGMRTAGCAIMSSRDWSRYISLLKGSNQEVERELGDLLFDLLIGTPELSEQGYIPESDVLIRHAEANNSAFQTIETLKKLFSTDCKIDWKTLERTEDVQGASTTEVGVAFADHLALLSKNRVIMEDYVIQNRKKYEVFFSQASEEIFKTHYHYNQLGPFFQTGAIGIKGVLDIGAMKDFNRHRSLERFIPFCENNVEVGALLENGYGLCAYLYEPGLEELRLRYDTVLGCQYRMIKNFYNSNPALTTEELRYLLPHAHLTPYRMYGSLDDMMYVEMLRIRPGGHINYRIEAWYWKQWMQNSQIIGLTQLWGAIPLNEPNASSKEEFVNRS